MGGWEIMSTDTSALKNGRCPDCGTTLKVMPEGHHQWCPNPACDVWFDPMGDGSWCRVKGARKEYDRRNEESLRQMKEAIETA
jgi:hypothetical protein